MLIWLLGCAEILPDTGSTSDPLVVWMVDVGADSGSSYQATTIGAVMDHALDVEVSIVDVAHPGRNQSVLCSSDDPVQGCVTMDWSLGEVALRREDRSVYLRPDGTLSDLPAAEDATRALGSVPETFRGQLGPSSSADWTVDLPLVYLAGNAPDGYRTPARLEVTVWEATR